MLLLDKSAHFITSLLGRGENPESFLALRFSRWGCSHPLRCASLQILRRPKRGDGAVCVMDPAGRRLKIPIWMLLPECAEIKISQQPHLGKAALLSLASLITSQLDFKDRGHDNLPQTTVNCFEEGRRGATSTSGPVDPNGARCRANGRSDTRRSDRSHGPRSGSSLSR